MVIDVMCIFICYFDCYDEEIVVLVSLGGNLFCFDVLIYLCYIDELMCINNYSVGVIIIVGSGMFIGGRILYYL